MLHLDVCNLIISGVCEVKQALIVFVFINPVLRDWNITSSSYSLNKNWINRKLILLFNHSL